MKSSLLILLFFAIGLPVVAESAGQSARPDAFAVMAEFERVTAGPLWPNFEPRRVPVAIYDGQRTLLFRHPHPPAEFAALRERAGVRVCAGQHEAVRANTSIELGGIRTATLILDPARARTAREWAAIVVHEAFHVFQRARHPTWSGNEGELFTYPVEDGAHLALRRLETEALRRALAASARADASRWAAAALELRRERFARLTEGAVAYERASELNEGLAQYVEARAAGNGRSRQILPAVEFAPEEVRARSYAVGQAFALLLDRLSPGWAARLEAGAARSLDELLAVSLRPPHAGPQRRFSPRERERIAAGAQADVAALQAQRETLRREFFAQPGWKIIIIAGVGAPLWPQGFDPQNVRRVAAGEVLHTRWLKLGNTAGTLEVLNRFALTEAAGAHPLFNGAQRITVAGLPTEPSINEANGRLTVRAPGFQAEVAGAFARERPQQTVTIQLGDQR